MTSLILSLPPPAFSREHSIRLENASVLKAIFQSGLVSGSVINKLVIMYMRVHMYNTFTCTCMCLCMYMYVYTLYMYG